MSIKFIQNNSLDEKINKQWNGRIMKKYTNSKDLTGRSQKRKANLKYLRLDHYKESAARSSNYILQELHPVQDQRRYIRHGTRLDKSELPNDTKYPIKLMRDHKLTELIVRDLHIQNKHIGTEHLATGQIGDKNVYRMSTVNRKEVQNILLSQHSHHTASDDPDLSRTSA
uniref:Uncharacterized protein n=1 Tax=Caenorhabditis japonica TaxID=281687 RepID=A0A8R1EB63_CAEJA